MNTHTQTSPPTVLLIDDEHMNRLIVGDYLRDSGYSVLEAESAAEGLRIFHNTRPDIVITCRLCLEGGCVTVMRSIDEILFDMTG